MIATAIFNWGQKRKLREERSNGFSFSSPPLLQFLYWPQPSFCSTAYSTCTQRERKKWCTTGLEAILSFFIQCKNVCEVDPHYLFTVKIWQLIWYQIFVNSHLYQECRTIFIFICRNQNGQYNWSNALNPIKAKVYPIDSHSDLLRQS